MNFLPKQYFHPPFTPPYLLHLTKREQYSAKTGQYFAFPLCFSAKYLLLHHSKPLDKTNYVQALIPSHINPFQPLIPSVHAERYYFQHLGLKNKLSQSSVLCITQDRNGFMWFGTKDGLNRYDGSNFRIFKHNHSNPHSLGNNNVNSLHENKDGKLWIGTDDGIYIYDPLTETFSKLTCKSQDSLCITQPIVQITTDTQKTSG